MAGSKRMCGFSDTLEWRLADKARTELRARPILRSLLGNAPRIDWAGCKISWMIEAAKFGIPPRRRPQACSTKG